MYMQAWRSYNNIRNATIVIQSYYRGWVAREEYRRMKYIKQATWAAGIIRKFFYGWKARKEVRACASKWYEVYTLQLFLKVFIHHIHIATCMYCMVNTLE